MARLPAKALGGLLLVVLLLAAPTVARAALWLLPGEPLTETHLRALVEPVLPAGETFELAFSQPSLPLHNPSTVEAFLQLVDFRHEPRTERFTGSILVRLQSGEERLLALGGRAQAMVEVPVPLRTIAAGERLDPALFEPLRIAERQLRADALTDPADLVDGEARRRLLPGRPLRRADVQSLRLVRRGEAVELVYRAPGIELVTTGRALEDGGRGSLVAVLNPDSGQRLTGVVSGAGQVALGAPRRGLR